MPPNPSGQASDEIRLAEFTALRQETSQRAGFQHALVALNLTVVGTVVGFVVASDADRLLLLVIPIVSPTLGLMWLDHHHNIARIASYIRTELWVWEPSWEGWAADPANQHRLWWAFTFWSALRLVFWLPPVGALLAGFPCGAASSVGAWLLWVAGLIFATLGIVAFVRRRSARAAPPPQMSESESSG